MSDCKAELEPRADWEYQKGAFALSYKGKRTSNVQSPAVSSIQTKFQQGVAFQQQGKSVEAERQFEEVLRLDPTHFHALNLLGLVALQTRRPERGVALIREAIKLDANSAIARFNLANGLKDLGRFEDAIASFDKAIMLKQDYAEAHYGRGTTLYLLARLEEALASFDKAVALKLDFYQAYNNRGITLVDLERFEEALISFDKAIKRRPDYAEAYSNRSVALSGIGRFEESIRSGDKAIALRPDFSQAYNNRGVALKELGRLDEALTSYDRAIVLNPLNATAFYNRGTALREAGRQSEAITSYTRALALAPGYAEARVALCMAQLPILYSDEAEIEKCRRDYREHLESLCADIDQQKLQSSLSKAMGSSQPFFLAYQGYNDLDLQTLYGSLVCRIMARRYPSTAISPPPRPGEPVRLGIVSGFFRRHSNWKLPIKGWLTQIDRRKFQIFGYHTSAQQDLVTKEAIGLCDRFTQGPMSVDSWRRAILNDAPHVILYPEVGMDPMPCQLAAQRLALVQCITMGGHPDTSGMPTVDYFLSSELMEPPDGDDHYTEKLVRLPNISIYYDPIEIEPASMNRGQLGLRADAIVFWCGQSLYKFLPQYDYVFAKIAKLAGNCQFVFLRHPTARKVTELFQSRLALAFAKLGLEASEHHVMLDRLTADQFVGAMGQCDVFLDSIGWCGCNSTLESLPCSLPIVTMRGPLMRGRHGSAILEMLGMTETITDSVEDYISVAARLANDPEYRRKLALEIAVRKQAVYRDRACILALEDFLDHAVRRQTALSARLALK
jgi:protein O-GlcNAc transferase